MCGTYDEMSHTAVLQAGHLHTSEQQTKRATEEAHYAVLMYTTSSMLVVGQATNKIANKNIICMVQFLTLAYS